MWGGESHFGIDCSGLIRRALMDALWWQGLTTANPALWRKAVLLWWYDSSARALRDGYRDQTIVLGRAQSLATLDHSTLLPGDFAVTAYGVHSLAYLGENTWIQADPDAARVIVVDTRHPDHWLRMPVVLLRFTLFKED